MRLPGPFQWICDTALKPALALSILATLVLLATLNALGAPLRTEAPPAGLFDALENYSLIRVLLGARFDLWPQVARISATARFSLVALGLVYALVALVAGVVRKRMAETALGERPAG